MTPPCACTLELTTAQGLVALACSDLCIGYGDATQDLSLVARELVHRSKSDVGCARAGMVRCKDVDALVVVGDLPASGAAG